MLEMIPTLATMLALICFVTIGVSIVEAVKQWIMTVKGTKTDVEWASFGLAIVVPAMFLIYLAGKFAVEITVSEDELRIEHEGQAVITFSAGETENH